MRDEKQVLRPADLAPLLGVGRSRIYQLIKQGRLPAIREGRMIRIPRRAWDAWLECESELALESVGGHGSPAALSK